MSIDDYTVHIVDDEEAVRKSLAFLLTMCGFTVRVHASATDSLRPHRQSAMAAWLQICACQT